MSELDDLARFAAQMDPVLAGRPDRLLISAAMWRALRDHYPGAPEFPPAEAVIYGIPVIIDDTLRDNEWQFKKGDRVMASCTDLGNGQVLVYTSKGDGQDAEDLL